jgi:hypothetical protein
MSSFSLPVIRINKRCLLTTLKIRRSYWERLLAYYIDKENTILELCARVSGMHMLLEHYQDETMLKLQNGIE